MKITIWQRLKRGPSAAPGEREAAWTYRFTWHGRVRTHTTCITNELAGGEAAARRMTRKAALAEIKLRELGRADLADEEFRRRQKPPPPVPTVEQFLVHFERAAKGVLNPNTTHSARQQLLNVLRFTSSVPSVPSVLSLPITAVSRYLIDSYARAVLAQGYREAAEAAEAAGEVIDPARPPEPGARRLKQLQRSANSTVSSARLCFQNPKLRAYYRDIAGCELPQSIDDFCSAWPFPPRDCAKGRDYQIPPDHIMRRTRDDLEAVQRTANPNLYAAVWLALTFGLRKGEIIGARVGDIETRNGVIGFVVRENWVARRPTDLQKNGQELPFIPAANDGLAHLAPFLSLSPIGGEGQGEGVRHRRQPSDYILTGPYKSCRVEYVFRDISRWMRALGWGTQKTIHEFRAYAICQVGMAAMRAGRHGLREAQVWARHSHITTTEQSYGRYFVTQIPNEPIPLPEPPPTGIFIPSVLPQASNE